VNENGRSWSSCLFALLFCVCVLCVNVSYKQTVSQFVEGNTVNLCLCSDIQMLACVDVVGNGVKMLTPPTFDHTAIYRQTLNIRNLLQQIPLRFRS